MGARRTVDSSGVSAIRKAWRAVRRSLAPNRRRVDFVIGGAQKGGTTALDAFLREHPQLCMAERKELHFFDDDRRFAAGDVDYRPYEASFAPGRSQRLLGESTPIYMYWRAAPQRVHAYNPAMKWILVLRDPVARAYSHWNMERQRGAEALSFADAVAAEPARCAGGQHRVHGYVDRGRYVEQLRRIWRHFPREQVLVLENEDLRARPQEALARCYDFLGVDRVEVATRAVHARSYEAPLDAALRRALLEQLTPGIRELERELGWDCSRWLSPGGPDADSTGDVVEAAGSGSRDAPERAAVADGGGRPAGR